MTGSGSTHPTELLIVDQFVDHRPLRAGPQLELTEAHLEGIKQQQTAAEGGADAGDDLDRFGGLDHPNDSRQHPHNSAFSAGGDQARRWRLGEEVAVVGAFGIQVEHRGLTFKAEDRAIDIGLAEQHAGVIDEVARGEVVGAVANDVVGTNDLQRVLTGEGGLVEIHLAVGVDLQDAGLGRFDLGLANPTGAMDHLPLQVAVIHHIEIHDAEAAHTRRRQIEQQR